MDQQHFVESLGLLVEALTGLTRMSGRILGWLMIGDAPAATMPDLTEALHTSKSAISTSTRQLIQAGLIERKSVPGQRRDVYQLRPDAWSRLLLWEAQKYARFRDLAEQGLDLLEDASAEQKKAMQEMADLNSYLAEGVPRLIAQWQENTSRAGSARGAHSRKGSSGPHPWEL